MRKKVEKVTKSTKYREKADFQNNVLEIAEIEEDSTVSTQKLVEYAHALKRTYKKIKPFDTAKMGRPKIYTDESPVWDYLIDQITHGRSLSSVLREDDMPYLRIVQLKLERDEKYRAAYEKAVQDRADRLADEIMELADLQLFPRL